MLVLYYVVGQMDFIKGVVNRFYKKQGHVCYFIDFLFQPTFATPLNKTLSSLPQFTRYLVI